MFERKQPTTKTKVTSSRGMTTFGVAEHNQQDEIYSKGQRLFIRPVYMVQAALPTMSSPELEAVAIQSVKLQASSVPTWSWRPGGALERHWSSAHFGRLKEPVRAEANIRTDVYSRKKWRQTNFSLRPESLWKVSPFLGSTHKHRHALFSFFFLGGGALCP